MAVVLLLVMIPVHAQSVRMGGQIIKTGMDVQAVISAAGAPTSVTRLVNEYGAPAGRTLFYRYSGYNKRTVVIQADAGGRVVRIEQCLGQLADGCS
jgi:hypothetical protein